MKNRTPAPPNAGQPIDFTPAVRRSQRHDGWTPERQRAFIEALADTGSVTRAAAMVNMAAVGAYYLRRQPGSESFRAAWSAALDHGVQRMKDIAFERAVEGELIPILAGGKLLGYRRRFNDRLLMFCLRHYGEDAAGKRTTINYFSTKASAGAQSGSPQARSDARVSTIDATSRPACAEGDRTDVTDSLRDGPASFAEACSTVIRTTITGPDDALTPALAEAAALIHDFGGVELDEEAKAGIARVLDQCAARRRAEAGTAADPAELFFAAEQPMRDMLVRDEGYSRPRRIRARPAPAGDNVVDAAAFLERSARNEVDEDDQYRGSEGEVSWELLDDVEGLDAIDAAVASIRMAEPPSAGERLCKQSEGSAKRRRAPASLPRSGPD